MNDNKEDTTVYVPEKKRMHFVMVILLILAGIILGIGLSSLAVLFATVQETIRAFLESLTGWDPIISSLFVGVMALFLSTLIFIIARRGNEIVQRVESILQMKITNEPTEFYALEIIPEEELFNEFKKRGCDVSELEGGGLEMQCPSIPVSQRLKGVIESDKYTLANIEKLSVITVIVVIWAIFLGVSVMDFFPEESPWIFAVVLLAFSVFILLGTKMIKLWHTIIFWMALNVYFTLFSDMDIVILWNLWGALAVYVVLVCISYLLYRSSCSKEDKWYCDIMK